MAIEDSTRAEASQEHATESGQSYGRLKPGAIGLVAVLFMAVANAAPITAMTGNVPIAVAYGNGTFAPAGFLVATVVLTLFTVGYVAMARHVTTAGAFYGFISHGLGQIWGMASGALATMACIVFEGSLVGIFSYFADHSPNQWFSWHVNWLILAAVCIAVVAVFGYLEAFTSVPTGGGSGVQVAGAPRAAGSAAIGLFFAFWSWVGYETTAVYGEGRAARRRSSRGPR